MKRSSTKNLTKQVSGHKIQDVQKLVAERMKEMGVTAYAVAKSTGIKPQTLSNFLRGNHSMRSDKLAGVMAVLGLEIRPKVKR